jgi:hypothetical protein
VLQLENPSSFIYAPNLVLFGAECLTCQWTMRCVWDEQASVEVASDAGELWHWNLESCIPSTIHGSRMCDNVKDHDCSTLYAVASPDAP